MLLSIGTAATALFFIVFSLSTGLQFEASVGFTQSIKNIYATIAAYSGLYQFTIIVLAFYATLKQIEISKESHNKTLEQIQFVQNDIIEKRSADLRSETLKQCNFYLNEMQVSFKDLIESNIFQSLSLNWVLLKEYDNPSLESSYPDFYKMMGKIERNSKNQVLIILYRLEAFSALFVHENLNMKIGYEIIGSTYSKQVGLLIGVISYFRETNNAEFCQNTIILYKEWTKCQLQS
ncbi:MAG TPA: hypothetical protein DEA97_18135 [Bacteroidales bacterium]|nr:MAG: hypothetical protein UR43_C0009G0004 [candidate division TM6 bacterium GW2011_GWF2_33_332]OFY79214.1 MAG: hypothetical protein A2281_14720 [Bacteroidetes bacterium RIFOXYA12_FULL_38_20]HBS88484.1 hypothetical protein [Bacteroidales bacterium]